MQTIRDLTSNQLKTI